MDSKLDFGESVLRFAFCADRNAIARHAFQFTEKGVFLQNTVLIHRANAAVKITAKRGKPDGEALAAHFDIAFAERPQAAKRFVGVGGKKHGVILVAREKPVCNLHRIVKGIDVFNVYAAFRIGNGTNGDIAAMREIKMDFGMLLDVRLTVLICFNGEIGKAVFAV